MSNPASVLFACTLNRVRSPMAEALARSLYGEALRVDSCGLALVDEPDPFVDTVLAELGVGAWPRTSKTFESLKGHRFELIVSLSPEAQAQAEALARTSAVAIEHWPTEDPTLCTGSRDQQLEAYRMVRDGLRSRLIARFGRPSTATGGSG